MPFKLRLKKSSRQYNVVSKSLYVICVELLDSTSIECTLSAESVGQECLDSVCQRLGLHQVNIYVCVYLYSIQQEYAPILCMKTDNWLIAEIPFPPLWVYQRRRSLSGLC